MNKHLSFFVLFSIFLSQSSLATYRSVNSDNDTPIHTATREGNINEVLSLLNGPWRFKIGRMNHQGLAPLHLAVYYNHHSIVDLLLQNRADVNQTVTRTGETTALDIALKKDELNTSLIITLLKYGANIRNDIIHKVVRQGDIDLANLLLSYDSYAINSRNLYNATPLYYAISSSMYPKQEVGKFHLNLKMIDFLILQRADVNQICSYSDEKRPLHVAVEENKEDVVKLLLEKKAFLNVLDKEGISPLHLTIKSKLRCFKSEPTLIFKQLLEAKAEVNTQDKNGESIFHSVLKERNKKDLISLIDMLLSHQADPNLQDKEGVSPFCLLISQEQDVNSNMLINRMLSSKADPNLYDKQRKSPLHLAVQKESIGIAQIFLDHKAYVDSTDLNEETPLHFAASQKSISLINLLLNSQADPNKQNKYQQNSLHKLLEEGSSYSYRRSSNENIKQAVDLLIDFKVDINASDNKGTTPLDVIMRKRSSSNKISDAEDIAKILIKSKADITRINSNQSSYLHLAIENGYYTLATLLVQLGLDINGVTAEGKTPLILSLTTKSEPNLSLTQLLLQQKADPNLGIQATSLQTPLHLACQLGDKDIIEALLIQGANVNALDKSKRQAFYYLFDQKFFNKSKPYSGDDLRRKIVIKDVIKKALLAGLEINNLDIAKNSLLHLSLGSNTTGVVNLLIEHKAEVDILNSEGKSPLYLALEKGPFVYRKLLDRGADVNLTDERHYSPLSAVWLKRQGHLVKELLERGATAHIYLKNLDPHPSYPTFSAYEDEKFMNIVSNSINELVELTNSMDLSHIFSIGNSRRPKPLVVPATPLREALKRKDLRVVECLLKHGARVDQSMLHDLIKSINNLYDYQIAKSINRTNQSTKQTEVQPAPQRYVIVKNKKYVESQYLDILSREEKKTLEIVKLLLKHKADPNILDHESKSPLHLALFESKRPYKPLIKLLQEEGADIHLHNPKNNLSLLSLAQSEKVDHFLGPQNSSVLPLYKLAARQAIEIVKQGYKTLQFFQAEVELMPVVIREIYFKEYMKKGADYLNEYLEDSEQYEQNVQSTGYPSPCEDWQKVKDLYITVINDPQRFNISPQVIKMSPLNVLQEMKDKFQSSSQNKTLDVDKEDLETKYPEIKEDLNKLDLGDEYYLKEWVNSIRIREQNELARQRAIQKKEKEEAAKREEERRRAALYYDDDSDSDGWERFIADERREASRGYDSDSDRGYW